MKKQARLKGLGSAYVGQFHMEQFRRDLKDLAETGVSRLFFAMSEEDAALRRPNLEAMAGLTRKAGLEPWFFPWGVGGVFAGPAGGSFVARHGGARQVDCAGECLPAACPNQLEFQRYMESWIGAAADSGAVGILWDEPSWARHAELPEYRGMDTARLWTCCCAECRRRFHAFYRAQMPEDADNDLLDFKSRALGAFLLFLGEFAHGRGLAGALIISPFERPGAWSLGSAPWLKEVGARAYWADGIASPGGQDLRMEEFRRRMKAVWGLLAQIGPGRAIRLWLRCERIGREDEASIRPSVEALRDLGAGSFGVWSYEGTATVGALACERPKEAWKHTVEALLSTTGTG